MREHRFTQTEIIDAPLERTFAFFQDAHNLERITPPWVKFEVLTPPPIEMKPGAIIDYRIRVRGMPLRWRTEIVEWVPNVRFVDVQLRGPYKLWHHTHEFVAVGKQTRMTDTVRYALKFGWIGDIVHRMFVRNDVRKIFAYRKEKTAALIEGD
ncbi:MAG: SRPBCC family protein [Phycisphaerae bacterium]